MTLARVYATLAIVAFIISTHLTDALYFYLEGAEKKCFYEELPRETMVTGIYKAEKFSEQQNMWLTDPNMKIQITVDEVPEMDRIFDNQAEAQGRFTFTSIESGDHAICLSVVSTSWFDSARTKMTLDMDFDDPQNSHHDHSETLSDLALKAHELHERVQDIRREQATHREREAEFRDQSELTNSRVVWWTILQWIVLGIVCTWQMRHYKNFFVTKKLV